MGGDLLNRQESLVYLAQQTGGFAALNPNDLVGGLGRIIDDTRGYYLLGFDTSRPAADMQVSVAPTSGRGRNRPASQWVDVEVRR